MVQDLKDGESDDPPSSGSSNTPLEDLMKVTCPSPKRSSKSDSMGSDFSADPKLQQIIERLSSGTPEKEQPEQAPLTDGSPEMASDEKLQAIIKRMKAEADAGDTGTSGHFYPSSQYKPKKKKQQDAPDAGAHDKKKGPKANGKKPKLPPKKQGKKVKLTKKAQKIIAEKSWTPPVSKYVPGEFATPGRSLWTKLSRKAPPIMRLVDCGCIATSELP